MTSIAFIMGVVPLVMSTGAGSEMRRAMGIAVFFGMLGVTFFGLLLTPVFYVLLRKLAGGKQLKDRHGNQPHIHGPDEHGSDASSGAADSFDEAAAPSPQPKVPETALQD
jgi:multidrug efflux pump